ncbi:unnamed protein product [Rotaria sordida]|uniref:Uncharacterized protein n=1 Tax=Rotaria sordida TaxID=392033 RepID=A0A819C621_9BILA|nr:unnamed protein product [Rotaria sordida]CAF3814125.1 unnamed protein product [Rotaria sordida]
MLNILGNTDLCSVSPICSISDKFHSRAVLPLTKNLRIFYNTIIKHIEKDISGRRITKIDAIQRTSSEGENQCRFLSEDKLSFTNISYVIEGSSWGEVLVVANASYLQGITEEFDGDISGRPWTYRRANTSSTDINIVAVNDTIIQNHVRGSDYGRKFLFLSPTESSCHCDIGVWRGKISLEVLRGGEEQSYGWHYWFRANAPIEWTNRTIFLNSLLWTGTCHDLAKMPYLRESRRSIGINNFLMNILTINRSASDLHGYIYFMIVFILVLMMLIFIE